MLKCILVVIFFQCCVICNAQNDSIINPWANHFDLKLSSSSSLIYPGLSVGAEFPFYRIKDQNLKIKPSGRTYFKNRFVEANLNWYHHTFFHNNVYLTIEWIMRRTRTGGLTSEFSFGPGYSRTFLAGTTYRVSDTGDISIIRNAGYNYALLTIGGGLGYDFSMRKKVPLAIFSKLNVISMFPYNSTIYFRPVLELGVRYKLALPELLRNKKHNGSE